MFRKNNVNYFYGQEKQLGKKLAFFTKEKDLRDWIRESPHRHQISQAQARKILDGDFDRLFKSMLDKDTVEPDLEYNELLKSRQVKVKEVIFNPYRDYNINYKGERF